MIIYLFCFNLHALLEHFNLSVIIEFLAANKSVVNSLKTCELHLGSHRTSCRLLLNSVQKVKVLDEVSQGYRRFAGPVCTITESKLKVNLAVNQLSYRRQRAAMPAQEASSEVKTFGQSYPKVAPLQD